MPVKLISQNEESLLNEAVAAELYASNLYKHVANQLQRLGYFGAQKFFLAESAGELEHYQRLADYLNDRGTVAKIPQVDAITDTVKSLRDAIEIAYDTEVQLGEDYERWYKKCDRAVTQQFLLFYLEEQRKAVGEFGDLLARLDRAGNDNAALLIFDKEMA